MRILLSVAITLLAAIAILLTFQMFGPSADGWSYAVIAPRDENLLKELNQAGALGWELVSARRAGSGEASAFAPASFSYEMILKRRGAGHYFMETPPK